MRNDSKMVLGHLGVLIGRTRSKVLGDRVFVILSEKDGPRTPQDMLATQRLLVICETVHVVR